MLIFGINPIFCLLFFLSAFLIDVDHYFYYVKEKNDLNLRNAYYYHKNYLVKELRRRNQKEVLMVFHTIEFFILLFVLSILFSFMLPVFLGSLFHEVTDLIYDLTLKEKKYKRAFSLIYYAIKNKEAYKNRSR
jgi:uncharacterized protein YqhQ